MYNITPKRILHGKCFSNLSKHWDHGEHSLKHRWLTAAPLPHGLFSSSRGEDSHFAFQTISQMMLMMLGQDHT